MTIMDKRLIDLTESDLTTLIEQAVRETLATMQPSRTGSVVSGRKNIADALGISTDKLDRMVADGYLKGAIKKNGRTMICDINKAFNAFSDEWNK